MQTYHVHLYVIAGKSEIDLQANSEEEAQTKALEKANKGETSPLMPSDCKLIAIPFAKE